MRSSIADYEVIEPLGATPAGLARYACRAPARLLTEDPVMITELAVGAEGWPALTDALARFSSVPNDHLAQLIEVAPDLEAAAVGVYLATELGRAAPDAGTQSDPRAAARLVADVAMGVHALHEAAMAHGRIDGWSMLSTPRGGVAWPPPLDDPAGLAARGGDWRWIATVDPLVLSGWAPTRGSDVWSLGALLHCLVSDRPLYPGIDSDDGVAAVRRMLFTRPQIDPAVPPSLASTIDACLSADPADRPGSAQQVARLLSEGVGG